MQIKFVDCKPVEDNLSTGFESFANNIDVPFNII